MINVSTEVKALVEAEAKAVVTALGIKVTDFNQDANAITAMRVLVGMGVKFPADKDGRIDEKVQQVFKKMGNASALRQAIDPSTTKKSSAASDLSAAALLLVTVARR